MTDALAALAALARWTLLVGGSIYVVSVSTIFAPIRLLVVRGLLRVSYALGTWGVALLYCPACVGFWCALGLSTYWPWPLADQRALASLESALAGVFVGAIVAAMRLPRSDLDQLQELLDSASKALSENPSTGARPDGG
jgi:hypothetical protein